MTYLNLWEQLCHMLKRYNTGIFHWQALCEQRKPLPYLNKELKWHTLGV